MSGCTLYTDPQSIVACWSLYSFTLIENPEPNQICTPTSTQAGSGPTPTQSLCEKEKQKTFLRLQEIPGYHKNIYIPLRVSNRENYKTDQFGESNFEGGGGMIFRILDPIFRGAQSCGVCVRFMFSAVKITRKKGR